MPKNPDDKIGHLDPQPLTEVVPLPAPGTTKYPIIRDTVERWATRKGMLPEFFPPPPPSKNSIPEAPRHNPEFWRFAGARAGSKWPEGAEMTEAEFDAAVEKFCGSTNVMR